MRQGVSPPTLRTERARASAAAPAKRTSVQMRLKACRPRGPPRPRSPQITHTPIPRAVRPEKLRAHAGSERYPMPCYFFSGDKFIRVWRGQVGAGTIDPGYPHHISDWGWGEFGAHGIDAALYSDVKCYFFAGEHYLRVSRGDVDPGHVDSGYPAPISDWGWAEFGAHGIDAALNSGAFSYFFAGDRYIPVSRGDVG